MLASVDPAPSLALRRGPRRAGSGGGAPHPVLEFTALPPMEGGYRSLVYLIQAAFQLDAA